MSEQYNTEYSEKEIERWRKRMTNNPKTCDHEWNVVGQYPTDESVFECRKCLTTRKFLSEL